MTEAAQNNLTEPTAAELTLAAPRFDAVEAQEAQPVVPLAEVTTRRRIWPLLLLSALLGSAVGIAAVYFYQQQRTHAVGNETSATQPQVTTAAQPETAQAATQTADVPEAERVAEAPAPAKTEKTDKSTEQTARSTRATARTRKAEPAEAVSTPTARRKTATDAERPARAQRPRRTQPPTPRTPPRNVDRIRDIFEGTPPPA